MDTEDNPIQRMVLKQIEERTNVLKNGFAEMEKLNVRTVPENIFKVYFLPLFCGENTDNDKELMAQWYTIAGTNYGAVNVVDPSGKVIIQVPPIHDRNMMTPMLGRDKDLAYTLNLAKEKASLSPLLASNIIHNELGLRFNSLVHGIENVEIKEQWFNLFKHYGKLSKDAVSHIKDTSGDEDEFEY